MENHPVPAPDSTASIPAKSFTRWFAIRWKSPRFAALCLGLLSTPMAAAAIVSSSTTPSYGKPVRGFAGGYYDDVEPVSLGVALMVALVAVIAASIAGGTLGGSVVRKQPVLGLALALFVAWPVAIMTLPLLPALLDWPYQTFHCAISCSPGITPDVPASGLTTYAGMLSAAMIGPVEVAVVLALIAVALASRGLRFLASTFTIAAFVALNIWSIVASPAVPAMIALIVGSAVWAKPYFVAEESARRPDILPSPIPDSSNQAK